MEATLQSWSAEEEKKEFKLMGTRRSINQSKKTKVISENGRSTFFERLHGNVKTFPQKLNTLYKIGIGKVGHDCSSLA